MLVLLYVNRRKMPVTSERRASRWNPFGDFLRTLCPVCGRKFIEIGEGQLGTLPRKWKWALKTSLILKGLLCSTAPVLEWFLSVSTTYQVSWIEKNISFRTIGFYILFLSPAIMSLGRDIRLSRINLYNCMIQSCGPMFRDMAPDLEFFR